MKPCRVVKWEAADVTATPAELSEWVGACLTHPRGVAVSHLVRVVEADGELSTVAFLGNGPGSAANAKLIAAAPTLAEIVVRFVAQMDSTNPATKQESPLYNDAIAALQAAGVR